MSNLPPEVAQAIKEEFRRTGKLGGLARAKNMTPEQRRKSAVKASKAAAEARKQMAKLKKLGERIQSESKALTRLVRKNASKRKKRATAD